MERSHLPRLDDGAYCGRSYVHWSFTMKDRKTGWLDAEFHQEFREILLHALGRYQAVCPVYCLMKDHLHMVLIGWDVFCNQKNLIRFLRRQTNCYLAGEGFAWQKQPFDNVIREKDRPRDAFPKVVGYVLENPVRAGLVERWECWPFCDSMIPGYPEIRLRDDDFWERFWRVYYSRSL